MAKVRCVCTCLVAGVCWPLEGRQDGQRYPSSGETYPYCGTLGGAFKFRASVAMLFEFVVYFRLVSTRDCNRLAGVHGVRPVKRRNCLGRDGEFERPAGRPLV